MSAGAHHTPTRRTVVRAGGMGVLGAAWLGGCDPFSTIMTQNFRFTVEDEHGKVLGSGVWQWQENVPGTRYTEYAGWDGEAFQIVHPTHGKMYVVRDENSGWGGLRLGTFWKPSR